MANMTKLFLLTLFIGHVSKVAAQSCHTSDLQLSQVATGAKVGGKPEWVVTIHNPCICTQQNVKLTCKSFQTSEKIDPSVLTVFEGICSLDDTIVIHVNESVSFKYAWDTRYPFKLQFSNVFCS